MAREKRGSREDQREITVVIEGFDTGIWDKMDGGDLKSTSSKYRRGGMGKSFSLGGHSDYDNATLSRDFDLDRDLPIVAFLEQWAGAGDANISEQFLDRAKLPKGKPITYNGTLLDVNRPPADSMSTNVGLITIVIEVQSKSSDQ